MDNQVEFTTQAFSKMVMHAMKYPHSVCCGLLLSSKPAPKNKDNCQGDDDNDSNTGDNQVAEDDNSKTRIVDAIPISHASHYLAPNIEIALNCVGSYAQDQELVISGYYQTDKYNETGSADIFGQKVAEKIAETFSKAILCFVSFEGPMAKAILELHHLSDGNMQRRPSQSYQVEVDPDIISECILYTKDRLYRKLIDFDDHFNNISLDWTNSRISQKIDSLVANIS